MKTNRRIFLIFGIFLVLLIIAAFSLSSFRLISSQTESKSTVAASNRGATANIKIEFPSAINGSFAGNGSLKDMLQKNLTIAIESWHGNNSVQPLANVDLNATTPILVVEIAQQDIKWTPVYTKSDVLVKVYYSDNGDISFKNRQPIFFQNNDSGGPNLQFAGEYTLSDVSWGIMSYPGYADFLAGQITNSVMATLKEKFNS